MCTQSGSAQYARLLSRFRRWLARHPVLGQGVRALRALLRFGPWRPVFRWLTGVLRPPQRRTHPNEGCPAASSVLPELPVARIARALQEDSVSPMFSLPASLLAEVRAVTDALPAGEYARFDEHDAAVRSIVNDEQVLDVCRAFFGAEPVLLECTVVVHENVHNPRSRSVDQRFFHFDYAGWQSLNLFVYLTEVDASTAAHEIVMGSHRRRTVRDLVRPHVPDEEMFTRFGPRIRTLVGAAGSAFFEDTEAFHRRRRTGRRRVMLNALFASHRGVFTRGRNAATYAQYLARVERLRLASAGAAAR